EKLVLHLVPCGIRRPGATNVIGNGVVVDAPQLVEEIGKLRERGMDVRLGENLLISERCHLILPVHVALDHVAERLRGKHKIGTTGRGIGPAYADRASRVGLRVGDLVRRDQMRERLNSLLATKNPLLRAFDMEPIEEEPLLEQLAAIGEELAAGIVDTGRLLRDAVRQGRRILLEGAQGVLLDVDQGTYPFVTSSSASTGGIATGTGMAPTALDRVLGVVKAYSTRVGEGPFPSELSGEMTERLRTAGNEFGSTTGRPRRCGWFDLVAVRYAIEVTGTTALAITNLDVLRGFDPLPIATAYDLPDGDRTEHLPAFELAAVKPVYEEMPGFDEDITEVREFQGLPKTARDYIAMIESRAGVPVSLISVGPERDQVIHR
ncbi:MAG: adenylosuccinate synthase, partial [Planctomycetota bacterium]